jgi:hypothetical protein
VRTLTIDESVAWVNATGLAADPGSRSVSLAAGTGHVFTVRWPKILPYQVPYFAALFLPGNPEQIDDCLFWIRDNGASGVMDFELACRMTELLRKSHGENRTLLDSPAYLLGQADSVDARMLLTMAVLFSWDAFVIPRHGRYFVWIDDDEAADVWCRERDDYESLVTKFTKLGILPEPAADSDDKV